jgi:predicted nucleotidyltransferase
MCYAESVQVLSTTPEVAAALDSFGVSLRSRFGERLQELTLFGSRARGDAREDSDVDVLVVIDQLSERERGEVFDLAWSAGMSGDEYVVVAPIPYSTAQARELRSREKRLMREIADHGVPLGGKH